MTEEILRFLKRSLAARKGFYVSANMPVLMDPKREKSEESRLNLRGLRMEYCQHQAYRQLIVVSCFAVVFFFFSK